MENVSLILSPYPGFLLCFLYHFVLELLTFAPVPLAPFQNLFMRVLKFYICG